MIRVRIELCPLGDTSKPELLGEIEISKKASGGYSVNLFRRRVRLAGRRIWRQGKVIDFSQRPETHSLLWRALDAMRGLAAELERRGAAGGE